VPDLVEKNKVMKIKPKLTARDSNELFGDSEWVKKI
jgi:hypothetical protein